MLACLCPGQTEPISSLNSIRSKCISRKMQVSKHTDELVTIEVLPIQFVCRRFAPPSFLQDDHVRGRIVPSPHLTPRSDAGGSRTTAGGRQARARPWTVAGRRRRKLWRRPTLFFFRRRPAVSSLVGASSSRCSMSYEPRWISTNQAALVSTFPPPLCLRHAVKQPLFCNLHLSLGA